MILSLHRMSVKGIEVEIVVHVYRRRVALLVMAVYTVLISTLGGPCLGVSSPVVSHSGVVQFHVGNGTPKIVLGCGVTLFYLMIVVFDGDLKISLISIILGEILRVLLLLLLLVYYGSTCAILHRTVMFLWIILEHHRFVLGLLGRRIAQTLLIRVSAMEALLLR